MKTVADASILFGLKEEKLGRLFRSTEPPELRDLRRVLVRVYPILSRSELAKITCECHDKLELSTPMRSFPFGGGPIGNLGEIMHSAAINFLEDHECFKTLAQEERGLLKLCFLHDMDIQRVARCIRMPFGVVAQRMLSVERKLQNAYLYENKERFTSV
jgi:hypothetical protein